MTMQTAEASYKFKKLCILLKITGHTVDFVLRHSITSISRRSNYSKENSWVNLGSWLLWSFSSSNLNDRNCTLAHYHLLWNSSYCSDKNRQENHCLLSFVWRIFLAWNEWMNEWVWVQRLFFPGLTQRNSCNHLSWADWIIATLFMSPPNKELHNKSSRTQLHKFWPGFKTIDYITPSLPKPSLGTNCLQYNSKSSSWFTKHLTIWVYVVHIRHADSLKSHQICPATRWKSH